MPPRASAVPPTYCIRCHKVIEGNLICVKCWIDVGCPVSKSELDKLLRAEKLKGMEKLK